MSASLPPCDGCGAEQERPGGLLFGVPDNNNIVKKWHVGICCFRSVILAMEGKGPTE